MFDEKTKRAAYAKQTQRVKAKNKSIRPLIARMETKIAAVLARIGGDVPALHGVADDVR